MYIIRDNINEILDTDTNIFLKRYYENDVIPNDIEILSILSVRNNINNLPNSIKKLSIGVGDGIKDTEFGSTSDIENYYLTTHIINQQIFSTLGLKCKLNCPARYSPVLNLNNLPNSIIELTLCCDFETLDFLHENIKILKLLYINNKINDLPASIKEIWIRKKDTDKINKIYHSKLCFFDEKQLNFI